MTITVHDLRETTWDKTGTWLDFIAANMRKADVEEVKASSALSPRMALYSGVEISSHGWVITDRNDEPIAVFGAAPMSLPGTAAVWMLGTDGIVTEGVSIARQTRSYIAEMNGVYPVLWNYIDDRNTVSKRWLKWAGFKLIKQHPNFGPESRPFTSFARSTYEAVLPVRGYKTDEPVLEAQI